VFALYDLAPAGMGYNLTHQKFASASIDELFRAFRNKDNIPSREDFLKRLRGRITKHLYISLRAGR
jgi:hypothetical protein